MCCCKCTEVDTALRRLESGSCCWSAVAAGLQRADLGSSVPSESLILQLVSLLARGFAFTKTGVSRLGLFRLLPLTALELNVVSRVRGAPAYAVELPADPYCTSTASPLRLPSASPHLIPSSRDSPLHLRQSYPPRSCREFSTPRYLVRSNLPHSPGGTSCSRPTRSYAGVGGPSAKLCCSSTFTFLRYRPHSSTTWSQSRWEFCTGEGRRL